MYSFNTYTYINEIDFFRTPEFQPKNPLEKKDLVKDAIQITITVDKMKQHFIWGTVNAIIFSMLTYDL